MRVKQAQDQDGQPVKDNDGNTLHIVEDDDGFRIGQILQTADAKFVAFVNDGTESMGQLVGEDYTDLQDAAEAVQSANAEMLPPMKVNIDLPRQKDSERKICLAAIGAFVQHLQDNPHKAFAMTQTGEDLPPVKMTTPKESNNAH
ncbi:MAG: hypothetical protein ACR2PR_09365 [Pseudohongiellaceae bacterium]